MVGIRKLLLAGLVSCLILTINAQDTIFQDTLFINKYHGIEDNLSVDDLLLYLVGQQTQQLAQRKQEEFNQRLLTDTTTAFPFHIGLADSLRIKQYVDSTWQSNPLSIPLLFIPLEDDTTNIMSRQMNGIPIDLQSRFAEQIIRINISNSIRRYISIHQPELYSGIYQPELLTDLKSEQMSVPMVKINTHKALIHDAEEDRLDNIRQLRKISKWYKEATTMLQISQNYVSSNWYAGGNSNFAMLGIIQGKIIYNDRKNILWKNTLEWQMGCNTVHGDSLRKVNTNEDIFKLYSEFGYKVVEKLNATVSAEFETQFFNTWKENEKVLKTGPFTPARFNLSVGMSYRPLKGLSILVSPLTYRMVGVADTTFVEQTSFSIPTGKKVLNEAGSSIRVEWIYKPVREIAIESKLYFYTNYKKVNIDLEVTADFIINRFMSARIMLHPKYDNTVIVEEGEKIKMQFKELISIGFSHKFH